MNLEAQTNVIGFFLKLIFQWISFQVLLIIVLPFFSGTAFTFNLLLALQNARQDENVYPMYFSALNYSFVLAHVLTQFLKIAERKILKIKFIEKYYIYITSILTPILTVFLPIIGWFIFASLYEGEL